MMVLFSGVGPIEVAQEKLAVGVGALAGSTIMLLCIPWCLSIYAGRVDIEDGVCQYKKRPKLKLENGFGVLSTGVEPGVKNRVGAWIMLATSMSYLLIQIPAYQLDDQTIVTAATIETQLQEIQREGRGVSEAALAGSVVCAVGFVVYLYLQYLSGQAEELPEKATEKAKDRETAAGTDLVVSTNSYVSKLPVPGRKMGATADNMLGMAQKDGLLLYIDEFRKTNNEDLRPGMDQGLIEKVQIDHRLMSVLRTLFRKYACRVDDDRLLDRDEFGILFDEMKLGHSREEVEVHFKRADINDDKHVNFNEFVRCLVNLAVSPPKPTTKRARASSAA